MKNMAEDDGHRDLPGSGGPPVEGPVWVRIKVVIWLVVLAVMLGAAYAVVALIGA